MSLPGAVYAMLQAEPTLTAIVGTDVYPESAGETDYPYVVYSLSGRERNYHLGGAPGLDTTTVTITAFTKKIGGHKQLTTLMKSIEDAIDNTTGTFDTTVVSGVSLQTDFRDVSESIDNSNESANVGVMIYSITHST